MKIRLSTSELQGILSRYIKARFNVPNEANVIMKYVDTSGDLDYTIAGIELEAQNVIENNALEVGITARMAEQERKITPEL